MSDTPSDAELRQAYEELKSKHELLLAGLAAAQGAYARLKAKHELLLADYAALQGEMAKRGRDADRPESSSYAMFSPWGE